jgi:hypothetical protein
MNLAEVAATLVAQRERLDFMLKAIDTELERLNELTRLDVTVADPRSVELQDIRASLLNRTGALWDITRNERKTASIEHTKKSIQEIEIQLESVAITLEIAGVIPRVFPIAELKAQPAPTPGPKPKVDKQEAPPAKRTPALSDTELQELVERLRAHDKLLESVTDGLNALKESSIPASQRATLARLHDLLGDPKSLGALELLLKIGVWADAKRWPTPRPTASAKARETHK